MILTSKAEGFGGNGHVIDMDRDNDVDIVMDVEGSESILVKPRRRKTLCISLCHKYAPYFKP